MSQVESLRILVISNFYPPYHIGGYELGCYEAVRSLQTRGHQLKVLTSSYGLAAPETDGHVYRCLQTYIGRSFTTVQLFRKEFYNRTVFKRLVHSFKPDVIYVWNPWQISLSLVYTAQALGFSMSYYIFDHWVSQWGETDDWFRWWSRFSQNPIKRGAKQWLKQFFSARGFATQPDVPNLRHAQFASYYLKQQALQTGKSVDQAKVVHWGLDLEQFPYRKSHSSPIKRLLYVGQLVDHKGVHVAIEALKRLLEQDDLHDLELTLVGGTVLPDYETHLKELVKSFGLEERVKFAGSLPREQLSNVYQAHDIMIVPSTWDEPFGLILLEAMASGLVVVGTATGGSAEILHHEVNGLVFPKEDSRACADCILRLLRQPTLFEQLRRRGRQTVEQHFRLEHTTEMIEKALLETVLENNLVRQNVILSGDPGPN